MRWLWVGILVVVVAGGVGFWFARQGGRARPVVPPQPLGPTAGPEAPTDGARVAPGCADIADSVRGVLQSGKGLPGGTRLVSASIENGVAVVELSPEFVGVNETGSTGEADAQNALRSALATLPRVRALRVLVSGNVFEGSHSGEWMDVPVRGGPGGLDGGE